MFSKILAGLVSVIPAIILAAVMVFLFSLKLVGGAITLIVIWLVVLMFVLKPKTGGKIWRRVFIMFAICSFILPLVLLLFTNPQSFIIINDEWGVPGGRKVGKEELTPIVMGVGFALGAVFLLLGRFIGREKKST